MSRITVSLVLLLLVATTAVAQTSSDLTARYGYPDVQRFAVRPGTTLMAAYGPDQTACQMIVQPKRSILESDDQSTLVPKEVAREVLEEVLPESSQESLIADSEQVVGCDKQVLTTYYNVTINGSYNRTCRASEGGEANVWIVRKDGLCSASATHSHDPRDVSLAQTATDLHTRYGDPDVERFIVRPGITLTVGYGTDQSACRMLVERTRSIIPHDEPAKYMRPEVVNDILDEVLPEADRGNLLLGTVTKSGCNDYETMDYQNVTVSRFRSKCRLPSPEIEGRATITRKSDSCGNRLRLLLGSKPRTVAKGETTGFARAFRRAFDWQRRCRLR